MSNQSPAHRAFDALGDPTRRRIVEVLRDGPVAVGTLAESLPVGRPAVSKHLKVLEGAGLVRHHSVGTRNLYVLAPDGLDVVQRWLVDQWDGVLHAFAEHVERTRP
jgi:DNA-binding transcriptional ArsR family regulator